MKKLLIPLIIAVLLVFGVAVVKSNISGLCFDGIDNDGDGFIDIDDIGCTGDYSDDEKTPWFNCDDGEDDDGDGLIDMEDPGCSSLQDWNEIEPEVVCINDINYDMGVRFYIDDYENWGDGDFEPVIYAGGETYQEGEYIPLINDLISVEDGGFLLDDADVPGIYLNRGVGYIYVALYGNHPEGEGKEAVSGYLELGHSVVTGFVNSEPWHGPVDSQGDEYYEFGNPEEDEIFHENLLSRVDFYETVTTGVDSFYIYYYLENVVPGDVCPPEPECFIDTDCGTDGFTGNMFCSLDDVFQDFTSYTCNNPGTQEAYCSSDTTPSLIETCEFGCLEGVCLPEPDTQAPEINLIKPEDGYETKDTEVDFIYEVNDESNIEYCSLIINDEIVQTDSNIEKGVEQTFSEEFEEDDYEWKISCEDEFGNTGESEERGFKIKEKDKDNGRKSKSNRFINLFSMCQPIWECGDWSGCNDGIKFRNCNDINFCESEIGKPIERIGCETEVIDSSFSAPTSVNWFLILLITGSAILLILILAIIIIKK